MSFENLLTRRAKGVAANRSLELHGPLLAQRREDLIGRAVADYKAKKLDGTGALLFVAGLAEIESLRDDLAHAVRDGQRASVQLTRS